MFDLLWQDSWQLDFMQGKRNLPFKAPIDLQETVLTARVGPPSATVTP